MLDSQFVTDAPKFIAGCMVRLPLCFSRTACTLITAQAALAAMMQLELPHINVLTKMDLLKRKSAEVEQ